ncbi:cellulose biosynthesis cyclic di-GMP-binding regulatory protein BcsB [Bosea sp. 117]|uniref:cellulose biosynthesis cyclic di-GMP-binding regulatory protein BcsB n=1 Tax=Bosea sp. 117 TaxID=1125973 RepID=UPI00068F0F60|nr:cellulose biosynthesis cyclic di-GMP-binding regulatory protein BcsB [Bosea sp. 117]
MRVPTLIAASAILGLLLGAAGAQSPAFDMNGSSSQTTTPAPPAQGTAPPPFTMTPGLPAAGAAPQTAPRVVAPLNMGPAPAAPPATTGQGFPPPPPATPAPAANVQQPADAAPAPFQMQPGKPAPLPTVQAPAATAAPAPAAPRRPDRYVVPATRLTLEGEQDSRSWVTYLTREEANRPATFQISYINAVVVMPEASRLRVSINGQMVIEAPIASSQTHAVLSAAVRPGILRPGANQFRVEAVQRHRTDCTIAATYELWTEIENAQTGLSFSGGRPALIGGIEDMPAIGIDDKGATTLRFVTRTALDNGTSARMLRAAQGIALRGLLPAPVVTVVPANATPTPPGTATVVVGTAAELPALMASPPPEARQQQVVRFVTDARLGGPVLVISAPTPDEVNGVISRLGTLNAAPRDVIDTATRSAPDAPLFEAARSIRLSDLGITTQEFSGRRFRTRFEIALPPDFYAAAYGEARLLIDAAYTGEVRPSSHIDFYVNGHIASNLPITTRGGGLFRREPMKIPLTNFRPGLNHIWVEVMLDTATDERCLPGATLPGDERFVLFNSTEFVMDNFARIGRTPDLAALSANAFPYTLDRGPLALVLPQPDATAIGSAGTLLARLAQAKGQALAFDIPATTAALDNRPAIFVGGIGQIANGVLAQVRIAETSRTNWMAALPDLSTPAPDADAAYDDIVQRFRNRQQTAQPPAPTDQPESSPETTDIYERWRENVSPGGISGVLTSVENWMRRTFGISWASFAIGQSQLNMFEPSPQTSVLIAQASNPGNNATWTLVAGRNPEALATGLAQFNARQVWDRVGGQAAAYQASADRLDTQPTGAYRFILTEPLNFRNFRMIAANWLSVNILPYALMLVLCGVALGISTAMLLRRLGRTK